MELNSQPPAISATIMQAVSNTAQRVLRSASRLPWSNRWEWRRGWVVGVPGICYCPVETSKIYYTQYITLRRAVAHTIHGKKKLLARVRRIAGQTRALEQALEEGSECAAVLQQIAAIRGAVNGLMNEVLEGTSANTSAPSRRARSSVAKTWNWW